MSQRDLRVWAGSLSPAWQAVVPGAFAWGVTIVRPAAAGASSLPLVLAGLAFVLLLSGPLLERLAPKSKARLLAFWGFVLASLAALGTSGPPAPFEAAEAIVGVSSWVVFAVTVAAPALGPEARGLHGRPDPSLAPRRSSARTVWHYFVIAGLVSVAAFAFALTEVTRERGTALALLAAASSVAMFAAIGSQVRWSKSSGRLHVSASGVLISLGLLVAALVVSYRIWRTAADGEAPAPAPASSASAL